MVLCKHILLVILNAVIICLFVQTQGYAEQKGYCLSYSKIFALKQSKDIIIFGDHYANPRSIFAFSISEQKKKAEISLTDNSASYIIGNENILMVKIENAKQCRYIYSPFSDLCKSTTFIFDLVSPKSMFDATDIHSVYHYDERAKEYIVFAVNENIVIVSEDDGKTIEVIPYKDTRSLFVIMGKIVYCDRGTIKCIYSLDNRAKCEDVIVLDNEREVLGGVYANDDLYFIKMARKGDVKNGVQTLVADRILVIDSAGIIINMYETDAHIPDAPIISDEKCGEIYILKQMMEDESNIYSSITYNRSKNAFYKKERKVPRIKAIWSMQFDDKCISFSDCNKIIYCWAIDTGNILWAVSFNKKVGPMPGCIVKMENAFIICNIIITESDDIIELYKKLSFYKGSEPQ